MVKSIEDKWFVEREIWLVIVLILIVAAGVCILYAKMQIDDAAKQKAEVETKISAVKTECDDKIAAVEKERDDAVKGATDDAEKVKKDCELSIQKKQTEFEEKLDTAKRELENKYAKDKLDIEKKIKDTEKERDDNKRLYNDLLTKQWALEDENKRLSKENETWRNRVAELEKQLKDK